MNRARFSTVPEPPLGSFNLAASVLAHLPVEVDERSVYGAVGVVLRRSDQRDDLGETRRDRVEGPPTRTSGVSALSSCAQPRNHRQDTVGDDLEVGVDFRKLPWRLEDVEVPVERDLIPHLRLFMVDPSVRRVRQNLALEVDLHILTERDVLGIAEVGIGHRLSLHLAFGAEYNLALSVAQGAAQP